MFHVLLFISLTECGRGDAGMLHVMLFISLAVWER